MGTERYIDPENGQLVEEYFDWSTGLLHRRKTVDVQSVLDEMHEIRGLGRQGWSVKRGWRHMGRIPNIEIERVLREEGINMMETTPEAEKRLRRYLRENPKFSTKF